MKKDSQCTAAPAHGLSRGGKVLSMVALVAALLWSSAAVAGGFYTPPHGVRTLGRAGAAVAGFSDLNALWYNPALLAGIEGHHVMVDLTLVSQQMTFERAPRLLPNGEQRFHEAVSNDAPPAPVPQLGYASNFGLDGVVFAVGAFAPNGATGRFPETGPQRYTLVSSEGSFLLALEVAIAVKVNDWFWIGGGIQNNMVSLNTINVLSGFPGTIGDPEDPDFDILQRTTVTSLFNPSANMGIKLMPSPSWSVGLSAQLPVRVEDKQAVVETRLPTNPLFDEAVVNGDTVEGAFNLPFILRAGVRYQQPRWDIELDVTAEFWSTLDEIEITPNNIEIENVPGVGVIGVGALNIPREYQNNFSVRLGGDWEVLVDKLTVRAGALYETTAIPSKTLSVLMLDMDKVAATVGLSWQLSPTVAMDLGYGHIFYLGGEVDDSVVVQLNPTNPEGAIVVANGNYEASADLFGLGFRFDF